MDVKGFGLLGPEFLYSDYWQFMGGGGGYQVRYYIVQPTESGGGGRGISVDLPLFYDPGLKAPAATSSCCERYL